MKEQPIVFERVYEAPIAKVWKALTDKKDMKQWYFDISDFKPEVGFEFSFVGGDGKKSFLHLCKIVEVVPYKKLKHSWRYDGYEGNSFVTWELSEEGKNKTRVRLTHDGLETFPQQTADFAKGNFIQGWTQITSVSLLEFVETADITKILEASISPDILWNILTSTEHIIQWASGFGEGTTVDSNFQKGSEVFWKDGEGNVGAKGIVTEREETSKLTISYFDDIDASKNDALGDYKERYTIHGGATTLLTVNAGPLAKKYVKTHDPLWDKALAKIKQLAESSK